MKAKNLRKARVHLLLRGSSGTENDLSSQLVSLGTGLDYLEDVLGIELCIYAVHSLKNTSKYTSNHPLCAGTPFEKSRPLANLFVDVANNPTVPTVVLMNTSDRGPDDSKVANKVFGALEVLNQNLVVTSLDTCVTGNLRSNVLADQILRDQYTAISQVSGADCMGRKRGCHV